MGMRVDRWIVLALLLVGLCCLGLVPVSAQETNKNYQEALRRMEEVRLNRGNRLNLYNLGLTELPPGIGELRTLEILDFASNHLTTLPAEIAQLPRVRALNLINNSLTVLPLEITQLKTLEALDLSDNPLTSLPPEIGQLTALKGLYLKGHQLTSLPPEIGQLVNLQGLWLMNGLLTNLPPEIGLLSSLRGLGLSGNQLTSLPPEIGRLTNLESLTLHDNPLTTLPLEIGQLDRLQTFDPVNPLGSPPLTTLTFPPVEIQQQGARAVVLYLRDYQAMMIRQAIALIAAGVGGIVLLILAFRWRQRRGLSEKKKRA